MEGLTKEETYKKVDLNGEKPETNPNKRKSEIINIKMIGESCVGITEFLNNNNDGFDGAIKKRYSDFNVNEIDLDNVIVHVTDQTFPMEFEEVEEARIYSELSEEEQMLVNEEQFYKLKLIDSKWKCEDAVEFDVTEYDNDRRKRKEIYLMVFVMSSKGFRKISSD